MARRGELYFDRRRYRRAVGITAGLSLALRAATMPPGHVFEHETLLRHPVINDRQGTALRAVYTAVRVTGLVSALSSAVRGKPPSAGAIVPLAVAEAMLARLVKGFAPYYDHLYVLSALAGRVTDGSVGQAGRRPPLAALVPQLVYLSSALTKLKGDGARDWVMDGRIIANAIDLYGRPEAKTVAGFVPAGAMGPAVLGFELLAFPAGLVSLRALRLTAAAGLLFHAVNAAAMRISFWHLAVFHLPVLYAIRRRRPPADV